MYDMSGFDYDIKDVAQILRLTVRHKNSNSMDVDCPFCGKPKKLNINTVKNVYRCNYCDEHGGMLQLYARLYNVSTSEANLQIREALNRGEYREDYNKAVYETKEVTNSTLASREVIHQTFDEMLSLLSLNPKHLEDLEKRGLTKQQIEEQRYRSVPLFGIRKLVKDLLEKGCTLRGVPGFYQDKEGVWSVHFTSKNSGILIPIVSLEGYIQGFQIRLDHVTDSRKYIWLSSVNYESGVSSGSPVHVIGNLDVETVYITEGALKGTIAHYLSGNTFVCVAGVNQYRNLKPVLQELQKRKLKYICEAYDMDKKMKVVCDGQYSKCKACELTVKPYICPKKVVKLKNIQDGCRRLYEVCRLLALPMSRMVWDADQKGEWNGRVKGIDDYYYEIHNNRL